MSENKLIGFGEISLDDIDEVRRVGLHVVPQKVHGLARSAHLLPTPFLIHKREHPARSGTTSQESKARTRRV